MNDKRNFGGGDRRNDRRGDRRGNRNANGGNGRPNAARQPREGGRRNVVAKES